MPKGKAPSREDENAGEQEISLEQLIGESVTLQEDTDARKKILDNLAFYSEEEREKLRRILENEKTQRQALDDEEEHEKEALLDKAETELKGFERRQKREKRHETEHGDRLSEEEVAKRMLQQLDQLE